MQDTIIVTERLATTTYQVTNTKHVLIGRVRNHPMYFSIIKLGSRNLYCRNLWLYLQFVIFRNQPAYSRWQEVSLDKSVNYRWLSTRECYYKQTNVFYDAKILVFDAYKWNTLEFTIKKPPSFEIIFIETFDLDRWMD